MKKIGGCRMGKANVTVPFATLEVSPEALTLTVDKTFADLMPCGVLTFVPDDVAEVRAVRGVPFLGTGVQVRHRLTHPSRALWVPAAVPGPCRPASGPPASSPRRRGCLQPGLSAFTRSKGLLVVWMVVMAG